MSKKTTDAFQIGDAEVYEQDPRFGLIALSEIAVGALSPAINDPGTAIDIIGSYVRLFAAWVRPVRDDVAADGECKLVHVPELSTRDMFDDAFSLIARDGATTIEVQLRLQKAPGSLASIANLAIVVHRSVRQTDINRPNDASHIAEVLPDTASNMAASARPAR